MTSNEVFDIKTGLLLSEHHLCMSQIEDNNSCFFVCQRMRKSQKGMDLQQQVPVITRRLKENKFSESKLAYFGYYKTSNNNTKCENQLSRWIGIMCIPQPLKIDAAVVKYEFRNETSGLAEISKSQKSNLFKRLHH